MQGPCCCGLQAVATLMALAEQPPPEASPQAPLPEPLHTRLSLALQHLLRWHQAQSWDLERSGIILTQLHHLAQKHARFQCYAEAAAADIRRAGSDRGLHLLMC